MTDDYEATKSAVYRELDRLMPSIMAPPDVLQNFIATDLPRLRQWANDLPKGDARTAYLYWLAYHERRLPEQLENEIKYRRSKQLEMSIPKPRGIL